MKNFLLILVGLVVAAVAAFVAWLFAGPVAAISMAALALGVAIWASQLPRGWGRRRAVAGLLVVLLGSLALLGWQAFAVVGALNDTSGPVAEPEPAHLSSANAKLDGVEEASGFRLELNEDELTALVQDGLAEADTPLGSVVFDVDRPEEVLRFDAGFRSGDLSVSGAVRLHAERGGIRLELIEADIGSITVPGALAGTLEDITSGVADFERALAESGATVQAITYNETSLVLVGTTRSGQVLTSASLLDSLQERAATLAGAVEPPPERLGAGRINGISAEGASYVVSLGDSLAANVGISEPRDGYVSRFHAEVERRDGVSYGLANFGISGETSGSLLNGGQLDEALEFMAASEVAYVTVDIGANDLLGHIGSPDCGDDLGSPPCQERIENTLATYRETLTVIIADLSDAAGEAELVFLQAYNPFSLGLADFVEFESTSNEIVAALNAVAAEVAARNGFVVADGFTPMLGTAAATTHIVDSPPDIHPKAIGFDILAFAMVEALQ